MLSDQDIRLPNGKAIFITCAHICPHRGSPGRPGLFTFPVSLTRKWKPHASTSHGQCKNPCPRAHKPPLITLTAAEGFRDASLPEVLRLILGWAWYCNQNPGREREWELWLESNHPDYPAQLTVFIHNVNSGAIDIRNTTSISECVFSDGSFGPEGELPAQLPSWSEFLWKRQWADLPTLPNAPQKPFDTNAARAGRAAMDGAVVPTPEEPHRGPILTSPTLPSAAANVPEIIQTSTPSDSFLHPTTPSQATQVSTTSNILSQSSANDTLYTIRSPSPTEGISAHTPNPTPAPVSSIDELTKALRRMWGQTKQTPYKDDLGYEMWDRRAPNEESCLPSYLIWVLNRSHATPDPLNNVQDALERVQSNIYWTSIRLRFDTPARKELLADLTIGDQADLLSRYIYVCGPDENGENPVFCYSWMVAAIFLNDKTTVQFWTQERYGNALETQADSDWDELTQTPLIISVIDEGTTLNHSRRKQVAGVTSLMENFGVTLFPYPVSDTLISHKGLVQVLLTSSYPPISKAKGVLEQFVWISSREDGKDAIERGCVVKREISNEGQHVYTRPNHAARFMEDWDMTEKNWKGFDYKPKFFAMAYNPEIAIRGEVRVFIAFGQIIGMVVTQPTGEKFVFDLQEVTYNMLRLEDLQPINPPREWDRTIFGNQEALHFLQRDPSLPDGRGTSDIRRMAMWVYHCLVQPEFAVNLPTKGRYTIPSSLAAFMRIDLTVIEKDSKLHYTVNEAQEGMPGLWKLDKPLMEAFVKGIERGSLARRL